MPQEITEIFNISALLSPANYIKDWIINKFQQYSPEAWIHAWKTDQQKQGKPVTVGALKQEIQRRADELKAQVPSGDLQENVILDALSWIANKITAGIKGVVASSGRSPVFRLGTATFLLIVGNALLKMLASVSITFPFLLTSGAAVYLVWQIINSATGIIGGLGDAQDLDDVLRGSPNQPAAIPAYMLESL